MFSLKSLLTRLSAQDCHPLRFLSNCEMHFRVREMRFEAAETKQDQMKREKDGKTPATNSSVEKSTPAADAPKSGHRLMRQAARRPRVAKNSKQAPESRLFVTALARGLDVLSAFRAGEGSISNHELASRTGIPKPTISRITHTLTQMGYLSYDVGRGTYSLGGRTLALSHAAVANLDIRRIARPILEKLAETHNLHLALALRDKYSMLNVVTCDGQGLIGLRLPPGSRVPIAVTAIGKAYLAALPDADRIRILDGLRRQHGDDWPAILRSIETSVRDISARGFCVSTGEWRKDINAVGVPIVTPGAAEIYGLSFGGPAYMVSEKRLKEELGPALFQAATRIRSSLEGNDAEL